MPISGLVIHIDPARRASVIADLQAIAQLELTDTPPEAPLVAVLEAASIAEEETLYQRIGDLPGVVRVSLSYHNFEDLPSSPH